MMMAAMGSFDMGTSYRVAVAVVLRMRMFGKVLEAKMERLVGLWVLMMDVSIWTIQASCLTGSKLPHSKDDVCSGLFDRKGLNRPNSIDARMLFSNPEIRSTQDRHNTNQIQAFWPCFVC